MQSVSCPPQLGRWADRGIWSSPLLPGRYWVAERDVGDLTHRAGITCYRHDKIGVGEPAGRGAASSIDAPEVVIGDGDPHKSQTRLSTQGRYPC